MITIELRRVSGQITQVAAHYGIFLVHQQLGFHRSDNKIAEHGVCFRLRKVTHAAHVRLNQHPMLAGLTRQGYAMSNYIAVLATYYHLYEVIERGIIEFLSTANAPFDYGNRVKLPWLLADLQYFGIDPHSSPWQPSRPIELALPNSLGSLIGRLYVIEGATLGGQVVSGHLAQTHGLNAIAGARFFNGYGNAEETDRRWQEFGVFAESCAGESDQLQRAEEAAVAIFKVFEAQLNNCHARLER